MRNTLKNQDIQSRPKSRTLLAVSLCASLAAFACTTDRNVGNGDPVVTPGLRTSPTGGNSSGTETESVPPPMMSSYNASALPAVRPRVSREEAALLLAEMQPRVKNLGVVAPGASTRGGYVSDMVAQQVQSVPQRLTVNSSIYSGPNTVVSSGAGEAVGVAGADSAATFLDASGVDVSGAIATGATSAATVTGSTVSTGATAVDTGATVTNAGGAVVAPSTLASATPTANSVVAPAALASVRTLSPTAAAVVNPPASVSSSPAIATTSSARTAGTRVVSATPAAATVQSTTATTQSVSANAIVSPVRVVNANGRVTVTNVTTSSRQQ